VSWYTQRLVQSTPTGPPEITFFFLVTLHVSMVIYGGGSLQPILPYLVIPVHPHSIWRLESCAGRFNLKWLKDLRR